MSVTNDSAVPDAVACAAARVAEAHYRGPDGRAVRQKTESGVVQRHLRLLDVQPGMNVMEIGTGSGLSAALLSELVGPSGRVVSVDLAPELVERAARLHTEAGRGNITSLARDGLLGFPEAAPYDRIIAWTTPPFVVGSWIAQAAPGCVVVQPVRISSLVYSTVMARLVVSGGRPGEVSLHRGSYVLMDAPGREVLEIANADAVDGDDYVALRDVPEAAETVLTRLFAAQRVKASGLEWPETEHLKTWLIARGPEGLISVGRGDEVGIGLSDATAIAYVTLFADSGFYADDSESSVLVRLGALVGEWCAAGRPRIESLKADLVPREEGWDVRARL